MTLRLALTASPELLELGRNRTAREVSKEIRSGAVEIAAHLEERDGALHVVVRSDRGERRVPVKGRR